MSLSEPGALYNAAKAPDLQDIPVMAKCYPGAMMWQEQALKTQAARTNLTPVLTRTETPIPHHVGQGSAHIPQR